MQVRRELVLVTMLLVGGDTIKRAPWVPPIQRLKQFPVILDTYESFLGSSHTKSIINQSKMTN